MSQMMSHNVTMLLLLCGGLMLTACDEETPKSDATPDQADSIDMPDMSDMLTDQSTDTTTDLPDGDMVPDMLTAPDPSLYTECASYAAKGPYDVGVLNIVSNDQPIAIWYPAPARSSEGKTPETYDLRTWLPEEFKSAIAEAEPTRYTTNGFEGLPVAQESFPLVLFSHGFSGYRYQSSELTTHLASWGFVVASSEHPERGLAAVLQGDISGISAQTSNGVIRTMRDAMAALNTDNTHPLFGRINMDQVGVIGHSAGGRTAVEIAGDDFVDAIVGLAPAVGGFAPDDPGATTLSKPTLFIVGGQDGITQEGPIRAYYDAQTTTRAYVDLPKAGHLAFSDICVIGRNRGGVAQIAVDNGIRVLTAIRKLSTDGCRPSDLQPERAWPAIHHFSTAYFRFHLGIDAQLIGLNERAKTCFDGMVGKVETSPMATQ